MTKETINIMIVKAHNVAKLLSTKGKILTEDNVGELITKANNEASKLNSKLDGGN